MKAQKESAKKGTINTFAAALVFLVIAVIFFLIFKGETLKTKANGDPSETERS